MLGVGEAFDHALYLLRDNGRVVLWAILLFVVPSQVVCDWAGGMLVGAALGLDELPAEFSGFAPGLIYAAFYAVVEGAVVATFFEASLCVYLAHRYLGAPMGVRGAVKATLRRSLTLVSIHLLFYPVFLLGYTFCVIPGIALYSLFFLRIPVFMLEGQGPVRGMVRALTLFPSAWVAIVCGMATMSIYPLFFGDLTGLVPVPMVASVLSAFLMGLVQSFEVALTVVLYFSARSRREHIDLDLLAQHADGADSTAPVL